jgi:hypothetical protein
MTNSRILQHMIRCHDEQSRRNILQEMGQYVQVSSSELPLDVSDIGTAPQSPMLQIDTRFAHCLRGQVTFHNKRETAFRLPEIRDDVHDERDHVKRTATGRGRFDELYKRRFM